MFVWKKSEKRGMERSEEERNGKERRREKMENERIRKSVSILFLV